MRKLLQGREQVYTEITSVDLNRAITEFLTEKGVETSRMRAYGGYQCQLENNWNRYQHQPIQIVPRSCDPSEYNIPDEIRTGTILNWMAYEGAAKEGYYLVFIVG